MRERPVHRIPPPCPPAPVEENGEETNQQRLAAILAVGGLLVGILLALFLFRWQTVERGAASGAGADLAAAVRTGSTAGNKASGTGDEGELPDPVVAGDVSHGGGNETGSAPGRESHGPDLITPQGLADVGSDEENPALGGDHAGAATAEEDEEEEDGFGPSQPAPPPRPLGMMSQSAQLQEAVRGQSSESAQGTESAGRQGTEVRFFGNQGTGKRIAFVIDCSGSMGIKVWQNDGKGNLAIQSRFDVAMQEVQKAVASLGNDQQFSVVVFNSNWASHEKLVAARPTIQTRKFLASWLADRFPSGGTDPVPAMTVVLDGTIKPRPDLIFLLSDGEFSPDAVRAIGLLNRNRIPIHTVSLAGEAQTLREIAEQSRGKHVVAAPSH